MAKDKSASEPVAATREEIVSALAGVVCQGDIVAFRLLFTPSSPARATSVERFDDPKYGYLVPDEELKSSEKFQRAIELVEKESNWRHIDQELNANRPPQLPSELLLQLADNAVSLGKLTSAAQAYELLRVRGNIQNEFLDQGDRAIESGDMARGVYAYIVGTGLSYDYAAFPDPLPKVANYQTKALMIHGEYPRRPEDCVALSEQEAHITIALDYLLNEPEASKRLHKLPIEQRLEFLKELVRQQDPHWSDFSKRYSEACEMVTEFSQSPGPESEQTREGTEVLEEEISEQQREDPRRITAHLLGREIENGQWWQYLKEIAFEHPASVLFLRRQVTGEHEVLIPTLLKDSLVPQALSLVGTAETQQTTA